MQRLSTSALGKQSTAPLGPDASPLADRYTDFQLLCDTGCGRAYRLYSARDRRTNKAASVFFLDKRQAGKAPARAAQSRRGSLIDLFKYEASELAAYRHPRLLRVESAVQESSGSLCYSTEPLLGTLSSFYESRTGGPFEEVELKCGLLQVTEALSHLHNCGALHGNLVPDNVFVTPTRSWKLGGLAFSEHAHGTGESFLVAPWSKKLPTSVQPSLNFLAPERTSRRSASVAADIFSLGLLVCWMYSGGKPLLDANERVENYASQAGSLGTSLAPLKGALGPSLYDAVSKMLSADTRERPTAQLFTMIKHFDDNAVSCLRQLDDFALGDSVHKAEFLCSTLNEAISQIPQRLWVNRVLPHLEVALHDNDELCGAAVRPLLNMLTHCDAKHVDHFRPWVGRFLRQCSAKHVTLSSAMLESMDVVFERLSDRLLEDRLLDMAVAALNSSVAQLRLSALIGLPKVRAHLSAEFVRASVIGGVQACISCQAESNHLQLVALSCLDNLISAMDSSCVSSLLTVAHSARIAEPEVAVAIAKLYRKLIGDHTRLGVNAELVTHDIMRPLLTTLTNTRVTPRQFDELILTSRMMLDFIEDRQMDRFRSFSPELSQIRPTPGRQRYSVTGLPQVLVTTVQSPLNGPCREISCMSDGRISYDGRRSSGESCSSGRRSSDDYSRSLSALSGMPTPRRVSADAVGARRGSWMAGYLGLSAEGGAAGALATPPRMPPRRSQPQLSASVSPARRHSCANPPPADALPSRPSSFSNLSHNLVCTLWNKFS